jgi:hypothetical protein
MLTTMIVGCLPNPTRLADPNTLFAPWRLVGGQTLSGPAPSSGSPVTASVCS